VKKLFALLLVAAPLAAQAPTKQVIVVPGQNPSTTLSAGVKVGNLLFLSGQLGSKGREMDSTITGQTRQALENMKAVLDAAHTTPENVVKCTVFLADMKDFQGMNSAYTQFFTSNPPARSTVAVAGLARPGAKVEIECIAIVP
jgi:2-iminobutanoate/2-iminopropanoate deaminase